MARVSGNVIGNFKGKLGNLSARIVDGDTILSARPSSFIVSQTQGSIEARQKFAVTANFANNVLEIPILETIWQAVKLAGMTVFNTVFKKNYDYVDLTQPTDENIITPSGFALPVTSVTLDSNSLALELGALNTTAVITPEEANITIAAMVAYFSPINPDDEEFNIIKLSKDVNGLISQLHIRIQLTWM